MLFLAAFFFFFKQKTAYEMRISDWSSDVCSSDLHAVTGFWVSGLALVLLFTALPWTDVWASGFRAVRAEMGWLSGVQDWKGGAADEHAAHDHGALVMAEYSGTAAPAVPLARIVEHARPELMPAPAIVQPPEIGRATV